MNKLIPVFAKMQEAFNTVGEETITLPQQLNHAIESGQARRPLTRANRTESSPDKSMDNQ